MIFRRPGDGVLKICSTAFSVLEGFRQLDSGDTEAGGLLLGRMIRDCDDVVVDIATVPSPKDRRSRWTFRRARLPAQVLVDAAWQGSAGTRIYAGEWHTHPEDFPVPSCLDRRDRRRILKKAKYEQDFLFFVIVGRKSLRVWEGDSKTGTFEELTLRS